MGCGGGEGGEGGRGVFEEEVERMKRRRKLGFSFQGPDPDYFNNYLFVFVHPLFQNVSFFYNN
jgi:hypothetical protein